MTDNIPVWAESDGNYDITPQQNVTVEVPERLCKARGATFMDTHRIIPRGLMIAAYAFTGAAWYLGFDYLVRFDPNYIESEVVSLALIAVPGTMLATLSATVGRLTDNYFRTGYQHAST